MVVVRCRSCGHEGEHEAFNIGVDGFGDCPECEGNDLTTLTDDTDEGDPVAPDDTTDTGEGA